MGKIIKFIFILAVLLGLAYLGLTFAGYQVHPENIKYYAPKEKYLDVIKRENRIHPLISRKRGVSGAQALDKSFTSGLKTVMQADKLETFERLKKDIQKVQAIADDRAKQVDSLTAS